MNFIQVILNIEAYIILIKKASGATASNILCHDSDTMIFDLALPGGILINTAALYGPNGDDDQYWKDVKSILDTRTGDGKMILGDFNVTLNFARDTSNYLTDPHKKCRKVINQWLYNLEFADVYEELHPGRSSYTWRKSIDKISREGDNNFRTANFDKQSRIDHILLSPSILDAVKSIEHIYYGRRISDHSAVVMKLDWAETNTGQGLFRCGADAHKNKNYQELIRDSFKLNLLDFVGETSKQNELRANLGHIMALKTTRDKVSNDDTINVDIRDTTVGELDAKIQLMMKLSRSTSQENTPIH